MRLRSIVLGVVTCAGIAFSSSAALAQDPTRGAVIVNLSPRAQVDPLIGVDIDGRIWPDASFGLLVAMPGGHHVVHAWAKDPEGKPLPNGYAEAISIPPGVTYLVTIPRAVYGPRTGLLAGGIVVGTLGLGAFIGSMFAFYFADGAGTQCHEEGIATGVCGQDPAPYLGLGGATLFFGLAGLIGGPVMIGEGVGKRVTWEAPQVQVGPTGANLTWHF